VSGSRARFLRFAVVAGAAASFGGLGVAPALASAPRARVGSVTPRPVLSRVTGATPASRRLRVTIELQPRDPLGLKAFATAVSTPGTPQYGRFVSVPQFARRFGARPADAAAVARTLRGDGLRVGRLTRTNMQLPVQGTIGRLEHAFAVSEQQVRMPSGRRAYANAQVPTLPVAVAPYVQGVLGLDDLNPERPAGLERAHPSALSHKLGQARRKPEVPTNGGPQPCPSATALQQQHGLTADELATAYGFPSLYAQGDFGRGQTIALFEEESFSLTNVQTYGACYGVPVNPQVVNVDGGPPANPNAGGESELDIEVVAGMDPQAAIQVYQGPPTQPAAILNAIVAANQAKVISSSWGACESITGGATIAAENTTLQEAAAQGQSFFISSGDSGSAMCDQATFFQPSPQTQLSVIDPGGQPFATAVGGTNLFTQVGGQDEYYEPGDPPPPERLERWSGAGSGQRWSDVPQEQCERWRAVFVLHDAELPVLSGPLGGGHQRRVLRRALRWHRRLP
jgi:kumamolisin